MPMQVGGQIAQAGDIHFFWLQRLAQCTFQPEHGIHEHLAVCSGQVGEFLDMFVPDHTAKSRVGRAVGARNAHDAPLLSTNNQFTAVPVAEFAARRRHASVPTRKYRCMKRRLFPQVGVARRCRRPCYVASLRLAQRKNPSVSFAPQFPCRDTRKLAARSVWSAWCRRTAPP